MPKPPEPRRSAANRVLRLGYALPFGLAIAGVVGGFVLGYGWYVAAGAVGVGIAIMVLIVGSITRFVRQHGDRALAKGEQLKTTGTQRPQQGNAARRLAMTGVSTVVIAAALLLPIREDVLGQLVSPPNLFTADDLRTGVAKLSGESERFEDLTVESDQLRATIPGAVLSYRGGTVKRDSTGTGVPGKQFAA